MKNDFSKFKFLFLIILFFGVFGLAKNTWAATINASSCSRDHVQTAINSAVAGDTVVIPSGNCTWTSGITLDKKLILQGAGSGSTVITRTGDYTLINMGNTSSRLTGIGFVFMRGDTNDSNGSVRVSGKNWRIDNCSFSSPSYYTSYGIWAEGTSVASNPAGLIDHSTFLHARILVNGVGSNFSNQNAVWAQDANFGSNDFVFVENCMLSKTLGTGNVIDANRGGKYVFRFNTYQDSDIQAHAVQGYNRGTRAWEIYNNTGIGTSVSFYRRSMLLRAGTGFVFNNSITGTWSEPRPTIDHRRYAEAFSIGLCNGSNPADGNNNTTGWLCRDQVGTGKDSTLTIFSGTYAENYAPITWAKQNNEPMYAWGNGYAVANNTPTHINANRDYYDGGTWSVQTSRTSPFNGASGVGFGTLANRPSSCTTGVAYWATDAANTNWNTANGSGNDGCLYKCANNAWPSACSYVPFTYPHPLRGGTVTPYCGDSSCNNAETCSTCPSDCGSCTGGNAPIITIVSPQANSNVSCSSDPFRINLQVATNVAATCRNCVAGSTCNSSTVYANMANFATTGNTTTHTSSPQVGCGASNITYYIRCSDTAGNTNQTSTILNFNTVYSSNAAPAAPTGVRVI